VARPIRRYKVITWRTRRHTRSPFSIGDFFSRGNRRSAEIWIPGAPLINYELRSRLEAGTISTSNRTPPRRAPLLTLTIKLPSPFFLSTSETDCLLSADQPLVSSPRASRDNHENRARERSFQESLNRGLFRIMDLDPAFAVFYLSSFSETVEAESESDRRGRMRYGIKRRAESGIASQFPPSDKRAKGYNTPAR